MTPYEQAWTEHLAHSLDRMAEEMHLARCNEPDCGHYIHRPPTLEAAQSGTWKPPVTGWAVPFIIRKEEP